jgi:hypothetical protein
MPIEQTQTQINRDAFLNQFMNAAFSQLQRKNQFPSFSTVPGQSRTTTDAQRDILRRALLGSPYDRTAGQTLQETAQGDYLDPYTNPAYQALTNRIVGDVGSQVNSRFVGSNRTGSQANSEALGRGITDALAPAMFQAFQQERGNQLNAARTLPAISQLDYLNLDRALGVGERKDARLGAQLQDRLDRYNFNQQEPQQRLDLFGSRLGIQPSSGAQYTPVTQNSFLQALGSFGGAAGGLNELFGADSLFGGAGGIFGSGGLFG